MADKGQAIMKGITKAIKDYGKLMGERNKIMGEFAANEVEKQQNWLWKMQQQQASPAAQYQRGLAQQFQTQQPLGASMDLRAPAFTGQPRPRVRKGTKGFELNYPSDKEFFHARIQAKKQKGMALTEKEQKFEDQYFGIKEKEKEATFQQRVNKSNALTMLQAGDFESRQEAEAYIAEELKVDVADPEIQQGLEQYRVAEEGKKRFFQKYPRKKKFGYEWEKRDDGKWHKVTE